MESKLVVMLAAFMISMSACNEENHEKVRKTDNNVSHTITQKETFLQQSDNQIKWMYSLPEGLKAARKSSKLLMVDFYADWCGWCKKLDRETYTDREVIKLSNDFICVKVNTDKNPEASQQYRVSGLPTIVFLNSNGEIIENVVGYRESSDYIKILSDIIKEL